MVIFKPKKSLVAKACYSNATLGVSVAHEYGVVSSV